MQFTGHSLPVHQSMSVTWDFYLVLYFSQGRLRDFFLITAIGMCHLLAMHHFGMACLAESKVNIQHLTLCRGTVGVFYSPSQLGKRYFGGCEE